MRISADDEEGWIEPIKMTEHSQFSVGYDEDLIIDRLYGDVKFVFKEEEDGTS